MKRFSFSVSAMCRTVFLSLGVLLIQSITAHAQNYTMFDPTDEFPATAERNYNNNGSLELGVRFHVTQAGLIKAIRFYKGTSNTGLHVGHLFNAETQALLGTTTFAGESASGWQQQNFSSPIAVSPGVIYVASVFMQSGMYSASPQGFGAGLDRTPIIGEPDDWQNGGIHNGVYDDTPTPLTVPPASGNNANNYWIDLVYSPNFTLPVTLSDFKATVASSDVVVNWKTSLEYNNKGFQLQRSNNGKDWYSLDFVKGAGESNTEKTYNYIDKTLAPGLYYYRLVQTDRDGKTKNSAVVTATVGGKGHVSLYQNFPNPFRGTTTIRFDLPVAQKARLSVIDMNGREVKVLLDKMAEAGSHQVNLTSDGLSRQLYYIRLQTETEVQVKKLVVQ
jgi:hypothetical protein